MNTSNTSALLQSLLDPKTRQDVIDNPRQYAVDNDMIDADADVEVKLVVNEREKIYVPLMKPDTVNTLSSDQLLSIQAAGTSGSAGTLTSASTLSSMTTTLSSSGTASTVGTAGSS